MSDQTNTNANNVTPPTGSTPAPRTTLEVAQFLAAALAAASFFLPLITYSNEYFSYSVSTSNLHAVLDIFGSGWLTAILLAAPIAAIVLSLVLGSSEKWRGTPFSVAGFIILFFLLQLIPFDGYAPAVGFFVYGVCGIVMLL